MLVWEWPWALWGLVATAGLAWLLVRGERLRREEAARFVAAGMAPRIYPAGAAARAWVRGLCITTALTLAVLGSARPRWGSFVDVEQPRGLDVFIVLDVSRSMAAQDVAPSRLERAKSDVLDLLEKVQGDRVGLVVFSGRPVLVAPLTTDRDYFRSTLAGVGVESAPRGGSRIGDALRKAVSAFGRRVDRDRVVVLISDGEDSDSDPVEAAQAAARDGVRIFVVGLGDPSEGARIPIRDPQGRSAFLAFQGKEVWSKLDEQRLEQIAVASGGAYIPARTSSYDLGMVYATHLAALARGEIRQETRKSHRDRFQWFLAGAALLIALDGWIQSRSARGVQPSIADADADADRKLRRRLTGEPTE